MRYLLIDLNNMFMRARHVARGDIFLQTSLSIHITLNSIRSAWKKFNSDHVVFCLEGRSWRKDVYPRYKANRISVRSAKTPQEQEEDQVLYDTINKFVEYIKTKTNCTVLQHDRCEADDFIAGWIQQHNESMVDKVNNHFVIISSDTDFQQLLDTNVEIYDGISEKHFTTKGIFDSKGKLCADKKGVALETLDPEWILFQKCIRGDTSDNIMSAYPKARVKGSAKTVGIREAFEDRINKGFAWNNFMLQRWIDHTGEEQQVKECYERNCMLIDLTAQPAEIKNIIVDTITKAKEEKKNVPMIGIHFLKFCGLYDLKKISDMPNPYVEFLSAGLSK